MSAFDDLQSQLQKAKDKVRKRAAEAVSAIAALAKETEYKRKVKKNAESMQSLLSDPRYADMHSFLTDMRAANQKAMETAATQDGNAYEIAIAVVRYGTKIELINNILEYPDRCISEMKRIEKESSENK